MRLERQAVRYPHGPCSHCREVGVLPLEQWERLKAINKGPWPDFCFTEVSLIRVKKRLKADQMDELRLFQIRYFTNIPPKS